MTPTYARRITVVGAVLLSFALPAAFAQQNLRDAEQLIERARQTAQRYVVRIDTVGGVQPASPVATRHQEGDEEPDQFRDSLGSAFQVAEGPTTGIIYSADGFIITSSINFIREPSVITVRLPDGRPLPARLVARDHVRKLAMLKVDATGLPTPEWATPEEVRVGEWAIALGRGLGGDDPTVSVGVVSALGRMNGYAIQTDASLSPINYGGPLLDSAGEVLGICVPMAQYPGELAGVDFYDSGIGFAIPAWRLHDIAGALCSGQSFERGWLGMQIDPHATGAVKIDRLADPSPLLKAGAQPGDTIVAINGRTIRHYGQLVQALNLIPAGASVHVRLQRDDNTIDVDVRLATKDELGSLPPVEEPFDPSMPSTEPPPESEPPR